MTPAVRACAARATFDSASYKWFDLTQFKGITYEEVKEITERPEHLRPYVDLNGANFPLPFEQIAVVDTYEPYDQFLQDEWFKKRAEFGNLPITLSTFVRKQNAVIYTAHMFGVKRPPCNMVFSDTMWKGKALLDADFYAREFYAEHKRQPTASDREGIVRFEGLRFAYYTMRLLALVYGSDEIKAHIPKATFTSVRQMAKGKPRAYNWSTVEIKPYRREPAPPQGGTHASPTPHERRGHVRRLKSGKVVTVRSSVVNKHKIPQQGITYHD
jgi:hypothetical protein